jgi:hypothetical protein
MLIGNLIKVLLGFFTNSESVVDNIITYLCTIYVHIIKLSNLESFLLVNLLSLLCV